MASRKSDTDNPCGVPAGPLHTRSVRPGRRTSRAAFFEDAIDPADPLLGFAPYLHKAPRRNSITPDRQRAFIAALAASGIVTQAARAIGTSLEALYTLRGLPGAEDFARAWERAIDRGMARLEDCALERALQGEERPVVSGGQWLGTWTHYDTPLLMFLLRHRRADRFGPADSPARDPQPGSAAYERVRRRIEAEAPSPRAVLDAIDAKIDRMRAASAALGTRWSGDQDDDQDGDHDGGQDGDPRDEASA